MPFWLWASFIGFVVLMLVIDLNVFHRKEHTISFEEALGWTIFWIILALLFSGVVYWLYEYKPFGISPHVVDPHTKKETTLTGTEALTLFITGYLVEKSLSLDNLFVIAVIMQYFRVPSFSQHRVLFWGILGALVMRGVMIFAGVQIIEMFHWTIYLFGGFLIISSIRLLRESEEELPSHDKNPIVQIARRIFRVAPDYEGSKFFTQVEGKFAVTPLFLVILVVESTDLLFAVDSIPAILAITTEPFIVFTSNIFAILGLRSLFFVLAAVLDKFRFLKASLVIILFYVGVKMIISPGLIKIPAEFSLGVIVTVLTGAVIGSILFPEHAKEPELEAMAPKNPEPQPEASESTS